MHRVRPAGAFSTSPVVDLTDASAVRQSVAEFEPDVIVHSAILNDLDLIFSDRHAGWTSFVRRDQKRRRRGQRRGARVILVSSDWVFDGGQGGADEFTPPNPVNLYGVLKMASELVVLERAENGSVARISGVNGCHWARDE